MMFLTNLRSNRRKPGSGAESLLRQAGASFGLFGCEQIVTMQVCTVMFSLRNRTPHANTDAS